MGYLFILALLLILNPYTVAGPLAYYAALPLFCLPFFSKRSFLDRRVFFAFATCIAVSCIGVLSSALHGITQIEHFKVALTIFVYYIIGIGTFLFCRKIGKSFDDFLKAALLVGVANGIVILIQVQIPQFRALVEYFFIPSGNIDWTEGFRYRGLASGGGASLSIFTPVCAYLVMYLYDTKKIGIHFAIAAIIVLTSSVFFIGRTGLLMLPLSLLLYAAGRGSGGIKAIAIWGGISLLIILLGFEYFKDFLIEQFGEGFYRYSFGYFLEGSKGFEEEGTIGTIMGFLSVVPRDFPEILIGYGFYGGSEFPTWTDSGYARMFLSVGYLFGFIFYASAIYIFRASTASRRSLFIPLIIILMIAEAKEALLFSGYASRFLFVLMGFWMAEQLNTRNLTPRNPTLGSNKNTLV